MMKDEINDIVKNVKEKEKKGEKELLDYLRGLTINDLNRLLVIFNGNAGLSIRTVIQATFTGAALVGVIIGNQDMSDMNMKLFMNLLLLFIVIYSVYWLIRVRNITSERGIIDHSHKVTSRQKILTLISFELQEKYKNL